ncbi:MAG: hypothetical protein HY908_08245 [Myxococcales bacterium]|nr:hypothetical protein [Myxococcales bacterium]
MHTPLLVGALLGIAATHLGLALVFARAWQRRHPEYLLCALVGVCVSVHAAAHALLLRETLGVPDAGALGAACALVSASDALTLALLVHFGLVYAGVAHRIRLVVPLYGAALASAFLAVTGLAWRVAPTGSRSFELLGLELYAPDGQLGAPARGLVAASVAAALAVTWLLGREAWRRRASVAGAAGSVVLLACIVHDAALDVGLVPSLPLAPLGYLGLAFGLSLSLLARYAASAAELGLRTTELARRERDLALALSELERTQRELLRTEELALVGELAAVVAHEVRNPLGIVSNAVASLRRAGLGADDRTTLIGILDEETGRLDRLAAHLKDYARPVLPARAPLDLGELARRGLERAPLRPDVVRKLRVADDLPRLHADAELLRAALDNLIDNALQAMGEGGELAVAVRRERVGDLDVVELEVRDNGEGMSAEARQHALQPFFTTRPTGTGLGLPICDRIVSAHGGTLDLDSRPGVGTRVRLRLPVDPGVALPARPGRRAGLATLP